MKHVRSLASDYLKKGDERLLYEMIRELDALILEQTSLILSHEEFIRLKNLWHAVRFLTEAEPSTSGKSRIVVRLLDYSASELEDDALRHGVFSLELSQLFKKISKYYLEYRFDPFSLLILDFQLDQAYLEDADCISLLSFLGRIGDKNPLPFLVTLKGKSFKNPYSESLNVLDDDLIVDPYWDRFRRSEDYQNLFLMINSFEVESGRWRGLPVGYAVHGAYLAAAAMALSYSRFGWFGVREGLLSEFLESQSQPLSDELEYIGLESRWGEKVGVNYLDVHDDYPERLYSLNLPMRTDLSSLLCGTLLFHHLRALIRDSHAKQNSPESTLLELTKWLKQYENNTEVDLESGFAWQFPIKKIELRSRTNTDGHVTLLLNLQLRQYSAPRSPLGFSIQL